MSLKMNHFFIRTSVVLIKTLKNSAERIIKRFLLTVSLPYQKPNCRLSLRIPVLSAYKQFAFSAKQLVVMSTEQ